MNASLTKFIVRTQFFKCWMLVALAGSPKFVLAQVNSGSDGHDGVLNPTTNTVINMADHPDGIYHYSAVNIPFGLSVSFVQNTNYSPVVWLVQSNCTIAGTVSVNGVEGGHGITGSLGGPGGWRGGNGAPMQGLLPESGYGPGGGKVGSNTDWNGGNASHSTLGAWSTNELRLPDDTVFRQHLPGDLYGNIYGLPLWGGSGGSGGQAANGGGGGGGAILLAVGGTLAISGNISARGGDGYYVYRDNNGNSWEGGTGGAGSGGSIRIVASSLTGGGFLDTGGGSASYGIRYPSPGYYSYYNNHAGDGRVRIEVLLDMFTGNASGTTTRGYTGIIFAPTNQQSQLFISSVGGQPVSRNPTGVVVTPDALIGSQQLNPVSITVICVNIPLNSDIIVEVRPSNGPYASAVGRNTSGAFTLSTATVFLNVPRGGGTIQAKVATAN
jgi:hypothetical protein